MSITHPFILAPGSMITVVVDSIPHTFMKGAPQFERIVDALDYSVSSHDGDAIVREIVDIITPLREAVATSTAFTIRGNVLYHNDIDVTGALATRVRWMMEHGVDLTPLERFVDNLYQNPSHRMVNVLYDFIEYGALPITSDGHFLAYKRVDDAGGGKLVDVRTGMFDNSVGQIVQMTRNQVDEDANNTCSRGLHVCSFDYLQHYSGDTIIVVKINPADVVAVPNEYSNTKMRVCRYEVIEQLSTDQWRERVLSKAPVMNSTMVVDEEFVHPDNAEVDHQPRNRWEVHIGHSPLNHSDFTSVGCAKTFTSREDARTYVRYDARRQTLWALCEDSRPRNEITRARVYDTKHSTYI